MRETIFLSIQLVETLAQNDFFVVLFVCSAMFLLLAFYCFCSTANMWSTVLPCAYRSHIFTKRVSNPFAYFLQSNNGLSPRAFHTLARVARRNSRSLPKRMAICSYSVRLRAIRSGQPSVCNWDAATLLEDRTREIYYSERG